MAGGPGGRAAVGRGAGPARGRRFPAPLWRPQRHEGARGLGSPLSSALVTHWRCAARFRSAATPPPHLPTTPHFTDPQKALNEATGNREYTTTAWVEGAEAVEAAAVGPTPPPLDAGGLAALRPGWLRRCSYSGTMMGSKVGAGGWWAGQSIG